MSTQQTSITHEAQSSTVESLGGRYLTFQLSDQDYGIAILRVREIIALQDITPIPGVPEYVEGVINLRGRIIPIIDLPTRLALQASVRTARTCIIVTEVEREDEGSVHMGCIVQTVSEVLSIDPEQIEASPDFGPQVDQGSILGLAKLKDCGKVVSLLDIERLLGTIPQVALS